MSKIEPSSAADRVAALENELSITKAELVGLRNSRSFRTVKLLRELSKSKPRELSSIIKRMPGLLQRIDPPKVESMSTNSDHFSSAHNPLPLMRFPNITVATVGPLAESIFKHTCNQLDLGGVNFDAAMRYNAIQALIIDEGDFHEAAHKEAAMRALKAGAKLVVITDTDTERVSSSLETTDHLTLKTADVLPFVDIYNLSISTPSPDQKIKPDDIIIIDSDAVWTERRSLNTRIANAEIVAVKGSRPSWISHEVKVLKNNQELDNFAAELSENYAAEHYTLACSRDTIMKMNSLEVTESILKDIQVIPADSETLPSIGIILATRRPENLPSALKQIENQTIKPAEVAVLLHGISDEEHEAAVDVIKKSNLNAIHQRLDKEVIFGDVLNAGLELLSTDLVSKMDDDDFYRPNHLLDLYVARMHSCADFVGKWNNWVYLEAENRTINWVNENSNQYVKHLPGGTFLVSRSTLSGLKFGKVPRAIDSELFRRAERRGATLYSTHRYNYIRKRGDDHTYTANNADFKSRAYKIQFDGLPLEDKLSL